MMATESGVSLWGDENVLDLDSGERCATLNIL